MVLSTALHFRWKLKLGMMNWTTHHMEMKQYCACTGLIIFEMQKKNCVLTLQQSGDCTYCSFVSSP